MPVDMNPIYCVAGEADVRLVYDITTIKELEGDGGGGVPRVTRDLRTCLARWEILLF